jgi:hypothetical protein
MTKLVRKHVLGLLQGKKAGNVPGGHGYMHACKLADWSVKLKQWADLMPWK